MITTFNDIRPRLEGFCGKSGNSNKREMAKHFGCLELIKSFQANAPVFPPENR